MTRRSSRRTDEFGFGSDSFLDVVANIVGILIILIVMVGVRVKNAPSRARKQEVAQAQADAKKSAEVERAAWSAEKQRIESENAERGAIRRRAEEARDAEIASRRRLASERQLLEREHTMRSNQHF